MKVSYNWSEYGLHISVKLHLGPIPVHEISSYLNKIFAEHLLYFRLLDLRATKLNEQLGLSLTRSTGHTGIA